MAEVAGWQEAVAKAGEAVNQKLVEEGHLCGRSAEARTVRAVPWRRCLWWWWKRRWKTGRLYSEAFLLAKTGPEPNPSVAKSVALSERPATFHLSPRTSTASHAAHASHASLLRPPCLSTVLAWLGHCNHTRLEGSGVECRKTSHGSHITAALLLSQK